MVARQRPTRGCLLEGLQEALAQFNRLSQTYRQVLLARRYRLLVHVGVFDCL